MPKADERRMSLAGFGLLRFQLVLLLIAIAIRILNWIFDSPTGIVGILLYTLVAGNVVHLLLLPGRPLFERRPRPWNWIGYLLLLIFAGFVANVTAELPIYFLFPVHGAGVSFLQAVRSDMPITLLIALIVGIVFFVFNDSRARLETQHAEMQRRLQSQVQLGLKEVHALQSDLEQAHEIQVHLLPHETPQLPGFQIACAWQPARSVSGDYFDVLPLGDGKMGLCIADVSGKGMAAALLMANLQASVKAFAREDVSPAELCSRLNSALCDNIAPGRFVTLFYAVLHGEPRVLEYESAGHCLPLLVHLDGAIEFPEASSGVLGLFSHWTFSDHEQALATGDVLVMVTDGVLEAWNAKEEEFGYKRVIESVLASRQGGAHEIRKRVLEDVTAFCNGQFHDDASLIVVTVD